MTTFEIACGVQENLITIASAVMVYSWDEDFALQQIRELPDRIKTYPWFSPIDPNDLTHDQMVRLGFRRFDEENGLMLIPLWLFPFLPPTLHCSTITGRTTTFNTCDLDTDTRFGMLAYGVIPKEPLP